MSRTKQIEDFLHSAAEEIGDALARFGIDLGTRSILLLILGAVFGALAVFQLLGVSGTQKHTAGGAPPGKPS